MLPEIIFDVIHSDDRFEARGLGHSIYTCADNQDELSTMIKDAVICHFHDSPEKPVQVRIRWHFEEVIRLEWGRHPLRINN